MAILEFIIALLFLCLLASLFTSYIIEIWTNWTNRKGRFLKEMLQKLDGHDPAIPWMLRLYDHPMVENLSVNTERLTSYIPASVFARALTDLISEEGEYKSGIKPKNLIEGMRNGLEQIPESDMKRNLKLILNRVEDDTDKLLEELESWYNEYMSRVNHTYRRKLRLPLFYTGLILAILFNIDFVRLSTDLYTQQSYKKVAAAAEAFVDAHPNIDSLKLDESFFREYRKELELNVGWPYQTALLDPGSKSKDASSDLFPENENGWQWLFRILVKLFGFALTGLVVSFGAPFWFDALKNLIGVKNAVQPKK